MRLIITADWHIRATRPRCRKDEYWIETQKKALSQVACIAQQKESTVMVVGDIFHSNSDTSFECIQMVQKFSEEVGGMYILAGNHDLLYHSSENLDKSAIGVLLNCEKVLKIKDYFDKLDCDNSIYSAGNFDEKDNCNAQIVFKHVLTIPSKDKSDFIESETPESLLEKFPNAKWIFTGDYHRNFHYVKNGRHVVNSGCLIRQVADMRDYQCGVYYVDTDNDIVEFVPVIDNEELVDDSYIMKENERDDRISNFVNKLKDTKNISLDFVSNVEESIRKNNLGEDVVSVINELMEV